MNDYQDRLKQAIINEDFIWENRNLFSKEIEIGKEDRDFGKEKTMFDADDHFYHKELEEKRDKTMRETAQSAESTKTFSLDDAKKFYEEKVKTALESHDRYFQKFAKVVEERLRAKLDQTSKDVFLGNVEFPKVVTVELGSYKFVEPLQVIAERLLKEKFPGWKRISVIHLRDDRNGREGVGVSFYSEITNG